VSVVISEPMDLRRFIGDLEGITRKTSSREVLPDAPFSLPFQSSILLGEFGGYEVEVWTDFSDSSGPIDGDTLCRLIECGRIHGMAVRFSHAPKAKLIFHAHLKELR
jgi:hypothetical protein